MNGASRGVIARAAGVAFDVRLKAILLANHLLKVAGVLPKVVPQAGEPCMVCRADASAEFARQLGDRVEMIDEKVRSPVFVHMRKWLSSNRWSALANSRLVRHHSLNGGGIPIHLIRGD